MQKERGELYRKISAIIPHDSPFKITVSSGNLVVTARIQDKKDIFAFGATVSETLAMFRDEADKHNILNLE